MNFQQIRDFVNPAVGQATGIEPVDTLAMPVPTAHLMQAGGGGSITVDSELSATSTNPVENRVITAALKNLGSDLYFIINAEIDNESGSYILDKTYNEIRQAIQSNKIPVIVLRESVAEDENRTSIFHYWGEYASSIGFYKMLLNKTTEDQSIQLIYDAIEIDDHNVASPAGYSVVLHQMA